MRPPRLLVLADDATGALEIGALCAAEGIVSRIVFDPVVPVAADALVIDTESRHLTSHQAGESVRAAASESPAEFVYKKTDSTLRGNIAAEFEELLAAFPDRRLVYVPAYPALGRTVVAGRLYVDGVPLEETAYARDLLDPARENLLGELGGNSRIRVWDSATEEEVALQARDLAAYQEPYIAAGPAGLFRYWIRELPIERTAFPRLPVVERWLAVSGSRNPLSREQAVHARVDGFAVMESPLEFREGFEIAELAAAAAQEAALVDGIIVFGGDTLIALIRAFGVKSLEPLGEALPGIAVSAAPLEGRKLTIVSKAGGFGPPGIAARIREKMKP